MKLMLKVLVVDDFPLIRRGVRELVIGGFQGAKIGEAGNFHEMLDLLRQKPWDVAVMDISMPGMNGLDALKQVKQELLSDQEYQVLCLIGSGKTVGEIADTMNLSVTTISTYRARILEKMRMKTNAELTRYAIQNGL